jgi:hypothetical protein
MFRDKTPTGVAKKYGVTAATVNNWCHNGDMGAVNVATSASTRARWRMSDEDLERFDERRSNQAAAAANEAHDATAADGRDWFAENDGSPQQ